MPSFRELLKKPDPVAPPAHSFRELLPAPTEGATAAPPVEVSTEPTTDDRDDRTPNDSVTDPATLADTAGNLRNAIITGAKQDGYDDEHANRMANEATEGWGTVGGGADEPGWLSDRLTRMALDAHRNPDSLLKAVTRAAVRVEPLPLVEPQQIARDEQYRAAVEQNDATTVKAFSRAWEGEEPAKPVAASDAAAAGIAKPWLQTAKDVAWDIALAPKLIPDTILSAVRKDPDAITIGNVAEDIGGIPKALGDFVRDPDVKTLALITDKQNNPALAASGLLMKSGAAGAIVKAAGATGADVGDIALALDDARPYPAADEALKGWYASNDPQALDAVPLRGLPARLRGALPDVKRIIAASKNDPDFADLQKGGSDAYLTGILERMPLGLVAKYQPDLRPDDADLRVTVKARAEAHRYAGGAQGDALLHILGAGLLRPSDDGLTFVPGRFAEAMRLAGGPLQTLLEADVGIGNVRVPTPAGVEHMIRSGAYDDWIREAGLDPDHFQGLRSDDSHWSSRVLADLALPEHLGNIGTGGYADLYARLGGDPDSTTGRALATGSLLADFLTPAEEIIGLPVTSGMAAVSRMRAARAAAQEAGMVGREASRAALVAAAPRLFGHSDGIAAVDAALKEQIAAAYKTGRFDPDAIPKKTTDRLVGLYREAGIEKPEAFVAAQMDAARDRYARILDTAAGVAKKGGPATQELRRSAAYLDRSRDLDDLVRAGNLTPQGRDLTLRFLESSAFAAKDRGAVGSPEEFLARHSWRTGKDGEAVGEGTLFQGGDGANAALKSWIGDSEVVDRDGTPTVMFHGHQGKDWEVARGPTWLTDDPDVASHYAKENGNPSVMALYTRIENPIRANSGADIMRALSDAGMERDEIQALRDQIENPARSWSWLDNARVRDVLKEDGYDGARITDDVMYDETGREETQHTSWQAFDPEQIKSATANRGTFDPNDPNILHSADKGTIHGSITPTPRTTTGPNPAHASWKTEGARAAGEVEDLTRADEARQANLQTQLDTLNRNPQPHDPQWAEDVEAVREQIAEYRPSPELIAARQRLAELRNVSPRPAKTIAIADTPAYILRLFRTGDVNTAFHEATHLLDLIMGDDWTADAAKALGFTDEQIARAFASETRASVPAVFRSQPGAPASRVLHGKPYDAVNVISVDNGVWSVEPTYRGRTVFSRALRMADKDLENFGRDVATELRRTARNRPGEEFTVTPTSELVSRLQAMPDPTVRDALAMVRDILTPTDPASAAVAEHIMKSPTRRLDAMVESGVHDPGYDGGAASGAWLPGFNTVSLGKSASAETMLHEAVHVVTNDILTNGSTDPAVRAAADNLRALHAFVKDLPEVHPGTYGLTNVDEFVAEAFSNPEFQATLKRIPIVVRDGAYALGRGVGTGRTLWTAFVETLAKMLGFGDADALGHVIANTNVLIEGAGTAIREGDAGVLRSANRATEATADAELLRQIRERIADAGTRMLRGSLRPGSRIGNVMEDARDALSDLWNRVRGVPGVAPKEFRRFWDATLQPDERNLAVAADLVDARGGRDVNRAVTVREEDEINRGAVRGAGQSTNAARVDRANAELRAILGLRTGQTTVAPSELLVNALSYIGTEKYRKAWGNGRLVTLTNRTAVPVARAKQVLRDTDAQRIAAMGSIPEPVNDVFRLNADQQAGLRRLVDQVADSPIGDTLPVALHGDLSTVSAADWNSLQAHLTEMNAGAGAWRERAAEKAATSGAARLIGNVSDYLARDRRSAEVIEDFRRKFVVSHPADQYLGPAQRDLWQGVERELAEVPAVVRREVYRVAQDLQRQRSIGDRILGRKSFTVVDLLRRVSEGMPPEVVPVDQLGRLAEVEGLQNATDAAQIAQRADDLHALFTASPIANADYTTQEIAAVGAMDRVGRRLPRSVPPTPEQWAAALADANLTEAQATDAMQIVQEGIRRRSVATNEAAGVILTEFAGSRDKAILDAAKDPAAKRQILHDVYSAWYEGRWDDIFKQTSRLGNETVGPDFDQGAAVLGTLLRLKARRVFGTLGHRLAEAGITGETTRLANEGVRFDRSYTLGSRPQGREGYQADVADQIASIAGWGMTPTNLVREGEDGRFIDAVGRRTSAGRDDPEARLDAYRLLAEWGFPYGKGTAWTALDLPGGERVFVPDLLKDPITKVIQDASPEGGAWRGSAPAVGDVTPGAGDLKKPPVTAQAIGTAVSGLQKGWGYTFGMLKTGLTTGILIPNAATFMGNVMGGAWQLYERVGAVDTARIFGRVVTPGKDGQIVRSVIRRLWNDGTGIGSFGVDADATVGRFDAQGRWWSDKMIADAAQRSGMNTSMAKAELRGPLIDDLKRMTPSRAPPGLIDNAWQRGLVEAYTGIDNVYRVAIFQDGLMRGLSETEAATIAREAAFDYGAMTDFEKNDVRKWILFYAYMRRNNDLFWSTMLENPSRILGQLRLSHGLLQNYIGGSDPDVVTPGSMDGRMLAYFTREMDGGHVSQTKQGTAWVTPRTPAADVITLMTDLASIGNLEATGAQHLASRLDPRVQAAFVLATGKDVWSGRDVEGYNVVPNWLVELDRNTTGGRMVDDMLHVRKGLWKDGANQPYPGAACYTVGEGRAPAMAWWAWRNLLQTPGAGRSMDAITALQQADFGDSVMGGHGFGQAILDATRGPGSEQEPDAAMARPGVSEWEELAGWYGIKPVLLDQRDVAIGKMMRAKDAAMRHQAHAVQEAEEVR